MLSFEKRGKLQRMVRARNRGLIVVCDRYPQAECAGFNDGPLLAHWATHPWFICRRLSAWEARPYVDASTNGPDLVLKLIARPEVAQCRRPEMSLEELRRRLVTVQRLRFSQHSQVVDLNADMPFEMVTIAAKQALWDQL